MARAHRAERRALDARASRLASTTRGRSDTPAVLSAVGYFANSQATPPQRSTVVQDDASTGSARRVAPAEATRAPGEHDAFEIPARRVDSHADEAAARVPRGEGDERAVWVEFTLHARLHPAGVGVGVSCGSNLS